MTTHTHEDETMKTLSTFSLSLLSLAAADVASAQSALVPTPLSVQVRSFEDGFAQIGVSGLEPGSGGAVIVICGLGGSDDDRPYEDLDPMDRLAEDAVVLGVVPVSGGAAWEIPARPEVIRELRIGVFALGQDAQAQFRTSKMKTAQQLAEDMETAGLEGGSHDRTGASGLEGETDPHFGEGLQLEVEKAGKQGLERMLRAHLEVFEAGLELALDQVVRQGTEDAPEGFDVYLTLRERAASGEFFPEVSETLTAEAKLGRAAGAKARVWLRRQQGCVLGEYEPVAERAL
jgi:hypothetical protein